MFGERLTDAPFARGLQRGARYALLVEPTLK
jgi:hypothetical protein